MKAVRALGGAHVILGVALLARPVGTVRAVGASAAPPSWMVRLLGARLLAQGAAELAHPSREVVLGGAAVDALHATSMLPVAAAWPRYRRAAAVSATIAYLSAAVAAGLAGTERTASY